MRKGSASVQCCRNLGTYPGFPDRRVGRGLVEAALWNAAGCERLEPRILLAGFDVYNPVTLITNTAADLYSIPTAFDWNYDGNWDLLVGEWGSDNVGHVRLFRNNGTNAAPSLSFVSNVSAGGSVIALGVG